VLFIKLRLKDDFNFNHLVVAAKGFFDPIVEVPPRDLERCSVEALALLPVEITAILAALPPLLLTVILFRFCHRL